MVKVSHSQQKPV